MFYLLKSKTSLYLSTNLIDEEKEEKPPTIWEISNRNVKLQIVNFHRLGGSNRKDKSSKSRMKSCFHTGMELTSVWVFTCELHLLTCQMQQCLLCLYLFRNETEVEKKIFQGSNRVSITLRVAELSSLEPYLSPPQKLKGSLKGIFWVGRIHWMISRIDLMLLKSNVLCNKINFVLIFAISHMEIFRWN